MCKEPHFAATVDTTVRRTDSVFKQQQMLLVLSQVCALNGRSQILG